MICRRLIHVDRAVEMLFCKRQFSLGVVCGSNYPVADHDRHSVSTGLGFIKQPFCFRVRLSTAAGFYVSSNVVPIQNWEQTIRPINEIGQFMGMKTIAEFVENEQILEKLREIGVDYAQGYGIDRPKPINWSA